MASVSGAGGDTWMDHGDEPAPEEALYEEYDELAY